MRRKAVIRILSLVVPALAAIVPIAVHSAGQASGQAARTPEEIYTARCAYCHETGGWGTRALEKRVPEGEAELRNRSNLPPAYTIFVVRHGIGSMPQFQPSELTDDELQALASWLGGRN